MLVTRRGWKKAGLLSICNKFTLLLPPNSGFHKYKKEKNSLNRSIDRPAKTYLCFIGLPAFLGSQHSLLDLLSHPTPSYIFWPSGKSRLQLLWQGKAVFSMPYVSQMCAVHAVYHLLSTSRWPLHMIQCLLGLSLVLQLFKMTDQASHLQVSISVCFLYCLFTCFLCSWGHKSLVWFSFGSKKCKRFQHIC